MPKHRQHDKRAGRKGKREGRRIISSFINVQKARAARDNLVITLIISVMMSVLMWF